MLNLPYMQVNPDKFVSAFFLTFSGNCKEALTFYQTCFGGIVRFETFEKAIERYVETPVICGSLVSDHIIIHGSDLVHNEGRILGNYMAICLQCADTDIRKALIEKLEFNKEFFPARNHDERLIEITDKFDVRWVLYASPLKFDA